jgi:hypothetical protein
MRRENYIEDMISARLKHESMENIEDLVEDQLEFVHTPAIKGDLVLQNS